MQGVGTRGGTLGQELPQVALFGAFDGKGDIVAEDRRRGLQPPGEPGGVVLAPFQDAAEERLSRRGAESLATVNGRRRDPGPRCHRGLRGSGRQEKQKSEQQQDCPA